MTCEERDTVSYEEAGICLKLIFYLKFSPFNCFKLWRCQLWVVGLVLWEVKHHGPIMVICLTAGCGTHLNQTGCLLRSISGTNSCKWSLGTARPRRHASLSCNFFHSTVFRFVLLWFLKFLFSHQMQSKDAVTELQKTHEAIQWVPPYCNTNKS